MANRFQRNQHEMAYRFIAARDGEYCLDPACRREPPRVKLQIDHADNNPSNWDPDNLHLLCQRHNLKMRQLTRAEHKRVIALYSAKNERESARAKGNPSTSLVKQMVDYRQGSPEMQANSYFENQYREWILSYIRTNSMIPKEEALYSGAEIVGNSPTTTARYLKKLTSTAGPLKEMKDATGTVVILFRHPPEKIRTRAGGAEVHVTHGSQEQGDSA